MIGVDPMPDVKLFTLDEAERTLPLVSRIVADIQAEYRAWREALAAYELAAAGARGSSGEPPEVVTRREAVNAAAARVEALTGELAAIGCELKDFGAGLCDFYTLLDDRLVYLCWQSGEPRITHWHELNAGFAGRQPINEALFPRTVP